MQGIAVFDLIVLAALAAGALAGLIIGFIRGSLLLLSWSAAAAGTVYAFPLARPYLRDAIKPELLADVGGAGAIFIFLLIVCHLFAYVIADRVRGSRLNLLDRSLGTLAGVALPAASICLAYLYAREAIPKEWLTDSKARPLVEQGAIYIGRMLPAELKLPGTERTPEEGLRGLDQGLPPAPQIIRPNLRTPPAEPPGYRKAERDALDRTVRAGP